MAENQVISFFRVPRLQKGHRPEALTVDFYPNAASDVLYAIYA